MLPRRIVPGTTYLVTRRCTQRQFLLKPTQTVNQVFLYCLAMAAHKTGVLIHAVTVLSNHYHIVCTDPKGLIPMFAAYLNKYVAKCLNAHYGRWENLWASEPTSYVELLSPEAVLDKTVYTMTNMVSSGLVAKVEEWKGIKLGQPGSYTCERPSVFFREEGCMPSHCQLELTRAPLGTDGEAAGKLLRQAVRAKVRFIHQSFKKARRKFIGMRTVFRQRTTDTPYSKTRRRTISPRVASRNKWLRIEALARLKDFVDSYYEALERWRAGDRTVQFPHGTYGMRMVHNARCSPA